jgi:two-component system, cell cycle sensor histidine kinase and response regulator CckA
MTDRSESPLVLVVDDDPLARFTASRVLSREGFSVCEAGTGDEALELFGRLCPHIVLLDVVMPGRDGFSTCSALRALPGGEHVPVLIVTGLEEIESIRQAYEAGATDFITKPINWLILVQRIRYMWRASMVSRRFCRNEQDTRDLLHAIPDLMFKVKGDGLITDFNAPKDFVFGLSGPDTIGKHIGEILFADAPGAAMEHILRAIETGSTEIFEHKTRAGDAWRYYESRIVRCEDQGALAIVRDITDRRHTEEEKEKLQSQLIHAQKMESVGRLAGGVAHDFNNMLGVIIGRTDLVLSIVEPESPFNDDLQEILKAANRSADLTRQLLAFARRQAACPKVLVLNDTISGMLKMLVRLIGEEIDLVWVPGKDLWKVKEDPSQVDQILANLAVNARDAITGIGSITLQTQNVSVEKPSCLDSPGLVPGDYVLLTVQDTGAGMTDEVLGKIFEPFFTTKELGKGTGLGLATVYGIVKQNNGYVYADSRPGKGTTFRIYLPRTHDPEEKSPGDTILQEFQGDRHSILLVEDDALMLRLTKEMLQKLNYRVLAVQNPKEAVHLAQTWDMELLLTDVVMPEMNGRELSERIRALKPSVKCLYMSGYTADIIVQHGVLGPGMHFIQKPFRKYMLASKLHEIFHMGESSRSG